ncbi:MAG: dTDP-4-dehydrorhamnose reductase [Bacteroidota bacterium]|nr:dTDP-4-dehydrorhamnose reductase [Bacteroidota bacterium]
MKKVLITGANGQLGSDLVLSFSQSGYEVIIRTHDDLDIGNFEDVENQLNSIKPDVLINTAAFHNVDQCEAEKDKAILINAEAPAYMARICKELNIRFIHFSTDYVFDGYKNAPYTEADITAPLNVYGTTKMLGEQMIATENPDHLIIRISAIYGQYPCRAKNGLNFIQLMLKLAREKGEVKVVDDEIVSPTATKNIAMQLPALLDENINGIIHMTSEGSCSWHEFAREIFDYTNTPVTLHTASSDDFPAKTPRPKYSVLENTLLKSRGINKMMHWKDALHNYLDELNTK